MKNDGQRARNYDGKSGDEEWMKEDFQRARNYDGKEGGDSKRRWEKS